MSHTRTFKVVRALLVQCLVCSTFFMPTLANAATEHGSEFDELLALNPGVSASELASALDAESSEKGMSVQEYARSVLAEQRAAKEKCESEMQDMQIGGGGADLASIDGTAGATYLLPKSDYVGDVYWSPGVPHYGHVGIFSGRDWIVEAAGKPGGSNWDWVWNVTVPSGTVLFYFHTSQATQDAAAAYAYNHLLHYPYNWRFWSNKEYNIKSLNCSQLVWYAYYYGAGLDVDGDGGNAVFPSDIRDSSLSYIYRRL